MPVSPTFKPVHIKPVTGFLDTRSTPDAVPFGGYRWALNFEVTQKNKLRRATGWQKLLTTQDYNNQDFHNQLLTLTDEAYRPAGRQAVNFLYQAVSTDGFSKLILGTASRLFALNNDTGNWQVISDRLGNKAQTGCGGQAWWAAQNGNVVVFTNGIDFPVYYVIDQPSFEEGEVAVKKIADMVTLGVSQASVVCSWNNLVVFGNVVQDGQRVSHRLIWSDYKRPLSFRPIKDVSLAGKHDLGYGETILGFKELGSSLLIYTTRGIWEAIPGSSTTNPITFRKRFSGPDGKRCLAYPRTLISTGDDHYYFGRDGIYLYNFYTPKPQLVEWIHRASDTIFNDINATDCNLHCGGYEPAKNKIWWSWTRANASCPTEAFTINTEFPFSSFVDHGFTAFLNYEPDRPLSVRQWILDNCICESLDALDEAGAGFTREGGYCLTQTPPECETAPTCFYSNDGLDDDDVTSEDYTGAADEDSLCALLNGVTVQDLCESELVSDACNPAQLFVMASATDNCLKQSAPVYYRERALAFTGCGVHQNSGYRSILRSGPLDLRLPDDDKIVNRFAAEIEADDAAVPGQVILRHGSAAQAVDPNKPLANINAGSTAANTAGRCVIVWQEEDAKDLECLSEQTMAEHLEDNTRPGDEVEWALWDTGRYFYFEIELRNDNASPKDTGAACVISRFTFDTMGKGRPSV